MLYFLQFSYVPNVASTNRLLAYYSALDKMGIKATVIYLMPDSERNKIKYSYNHINIIYLWEKVFLYNRYSKFFYYKYFIWKLKRKFQPGDNVYTYDISLLTKIATDINGVNVFCERTEHPEANKQFVSRLIALSEDEMWATYRKVKGLFVISTPLYNYFVEHGIEKNRVHIINMIADPARFLGLKKHENVEKYIAYCGTASNNKDGVDELIKSFSIVTKKFNDIRLYIIGNTPDITDSAGNIKLIEELGIKDKVKFLGIVAAENIPQILKNAMVLALDRPDSIQAKHGFPTKLGEYLLTENPVVITKVGDIPKFLKDGINALLAEERNAKEFASKLIWALTHTKEAAEIGKNGAQLAKKEFNNEIECKKILDAIFS